MDEGQHDRTAIAVDLPAEPRHIIKRPRLTKLLDEADTQRILLIAPAGYGKTTLAREWLAQEGRTGLWFRAAVSASDIGAVARTLARAIAPVSPTAERTVREFLAAHPEPDPDELAGVLVGDLSAWPVDMWLVLDEWELLRDKEAPAKFVEAFVTGSGARVLVTSRERPSWVRTRDLLYGDAFELDRAQLAMTADEAAEALADAAHAQPGLVALADGWPAVIGLVSALSRDFTPEPERQEALFDHLAQELFGGLDSRIQRHLVLLAVPAGPSYALIHEVVGPDAKQVLEDSVRVGLMTLRDDEVEIHPLCRSFLKRKLTSVRIDGEQVDRLAEYLVKTGEWDDAFEVIHRFALVDKFPLLLAQGVEKAVAEGRVSTIEEWINWAEGHGIEMPEIGLARAQMYLFRGNWQVSRELALSCASRLTSPRLVAQAHLCAGTAAQLLDDVDDALRLYSNALLSDDSPDIRRRALWGRFVSSYWADRPDYLDALAALEAADDSSPEHLLRLCQAQLISAGRNGTFDGPLEQALVRIVLLERVEDPFIRSGFLHNVAYALNLSARYAEAEHFATLELDEGKRFKLAFVSPNGLLNLASAKFGLGSYTAATGLIDRSERDDTTNDDFIRVKRAILRADVDLARSHATTAMASLRNISLEGARTDICGEALATRALAEACAGDVEAAEITMDEAAPRAIDITSQVLLAATQAVIALHKAEHDMSKQLAHLATTVNATGCYDALICALRAHSDLLRASVENDAMNAVVVAAARRSGDASLRSATGMGALHSSHAHLSPRERDVLALAAQGFHNDEIGLRLFISPKTVKTHLQNIYEKLGVSSRTEAAIKAKDAGLLD
jgi:ATP/maltotriose-dependent transcriptional regulator MalT